MEKSNLITVTIRSHLRPSTNIQGFALGKPFLFQIESNSGIEGLMQHLFRKNIKDLGLVSVNGRLAKDDIRLVEGDVVFIFSPAMGG